MTRDEQEILDRQPHDAVICTRCGATLGNYRRGEKCVATISEACPGFNWVERAIRHATTGEQG